jgi:hypothetical protein
LCELQQSVRLCSRQRGNATSGYLVFDQKQSAEVIEMAKEMERPGHDELVNLGENQGSPYLAKASDFKSPGGGKHGESSGHNELAAQTSNQQGPGRPEDSGDMTPSVWGKGGTEFPAGKAKGGEAGTDVSGRETVDLSTGEIHCGGHKATRVKEVPAY